MPPCFSVELPQFGSLVILVSINQLPAMNYISYCISLVQTTTVMKGTILVLLLSFLKIPCVVNFIFVKEMSSQHCWFATILVWWSCVALKPKRRRKAMGTSYLDLNRTRWGHDASMVQSGHRSTRNRFLEAFLCSLKRNCTTPKVNAELNAPGVIHRPTSNHICTLRYMYSFAFTSIKSVLLLTISS